MSGSDAANGASVTERLAQLCELAAHLPGSVSIQLAADEALVREVARLAGAQAYGLIRADMDAVPCVCWSVAAQLDRVHITAAFSRSATRAEIRAVTKWQEGETGWTGMLHQLVEPEVAP